jgi:aminopeptidase N
MVTLAGVTDPHDATRYDRAIRVVAVTAALSLALAGCTPGTPTTDPSSTTTQTTEPDAGLDVEAGRSNPVRDPVYPDYGNTSLDVLAYRLVLAWNDDAQELTGTATLTIRAAAPVADLQLDFSKAYTVDSVAVDGTETPSTWQGPDLSVPKQLTADARTTLVVKYHGRPTTVPMPSARDDFDEGLGLRVTQSGEAWTMQEPYGASTWYPVNDTPWDEAVYDVRVTVPDGWSAVAHGKLLDIQDGPNGGDDTFHWRSTDPVASYLATLAIGRYTKIEDSGEGKLPLTYWLRTGRDEGFEPVVRRSPELLSWLAERFGPYPFPSAGVVLVDSESAMETQQMVTYGAKLGPGANDPDYAAEVLLHEYAHQWFGDAVTPTDWNGLWLNEGWAMYCEMLWTIDQGFLKDSDWVTWARGEDASSRAVAGPPGHPNPGHFAEVNVYAGPAMLLRAIHKAVGDEAFFAMGRDWVQRNRNTQVDRAEFIQHVNEHTGRDFTALINSWLDSPTTPPA